MKEPTTGIDAAISLIKRSPELRRGAVGGTVGEVEDYSKRKLAAILDFRHYMHALTLLDTVLLGALVVLVLLLLGNALDTLFVVVLVGGALSGVGAIYKNC